MVAGVYFCIPDEEEVWLSHWGKRSASHKNVLTMEGPGGRLAKMKVAFLVEETTCVNVRPYSSSLIGASARIRFPSDCVNQGTFAWRCRLVITF